jgi:hypothetical protein
MVMKNISMVLAAALLALLPLAAVASHSSSGSSQGSRTTTAAPAPRGGGSTKGSTVQASKAAKATSSQNRVANKNYGVASAPRGIALSQGAVVRNNSITVHSSFRVGILWHGGYYGGFWYGIGWYYPMMLYPGVWYWNSQFAYQYEFAPYGNTVSGIKFDLNQIKKGADRKAVDQAGVYLPDKEGKTGYLGAVGNFSGILHKALPLAPGTYDLKVVVADGRELDMIVEVQPGRVTHVALRFDEPSSAEQESAEANAPASDDNEKPLVLAPAPGSQPTASVVSDKD